MNPMLLALPALFALQEPWPRSVPEASTFQRTSRVEDIRAFMAALARRCPDLQPYAPPGAPARAEGGKPLLGWRLKATGPEPLRVAVVANIHAGEVEGKEAVQLLVRELAEGAHPAWRRAIDLVVVPAYNADGTDALDPANRRHQPNPEGGVGRRENARGLDLNRDLMKVQAASTRWFLALARDFDPHVVFDLHTTNGSTHGFHLTHAPAAALGADPKLERFNRDLLVQVRERLKGEGLPTYDYGTFTPERPLPGQPPTGWETYDNLPRYLSNYPALRNRLGILSEAYVYRTLPQRIEDTRRFVAACLDDLVSRKPEVLQAIGEAEEGWRASLPPLPLASERQLTERYTFDAVDPIKDAQGRLIGEKGRTTLVLPSHVTWKPTALVRPPAGFLVDRAFADRVRPVLEAHGLRILQGDQRPQLPVRSFRETGRTLARAAYQGVFALDLRGEWTADSPRGWSAEDLDQALFVPLDQPLGRLAFYLLDPRSPDGLVHWGLFHEVLLREGMWGEAPRFPLLAVGGPAQEPSEPKATGMPFTRAE